MNQTPIALESYPLSPMQAGMLFDHLYSWDSGVNIEQLLCTLVEPVDALLLRAAWERLVGRHPILRTSFRWEELDEPVQDVHPTVELPWVNEDWGHLSPERAREELQARTTADRRRGFDLRRAPLMRITLLRRGPGDFVLLWTFHHGLLDGRSFEPLLREVFSEYDALRRGEEFKPPKRPPYRNYIEWLAGQDLSGAETFWRQRLRGFTTPTPLPAAFAARNSDSRSAAPAEQTLVLPEEAASRLRSLSQENGLTLNTFVQGAWAVLLCRHSGQEDVVFGATRACRNGTIADAESVLGMFINTLPVRVRVSSDRELLPWLLELRRQQIEVRPYEHAPLLRVQEWSDLSRGTPLFSSLLVFEKYQLNTVLRANGGEWEHRSFQLFEKTSYPLTLAANSESGLTLTLACDPTYYDESIVGILLRQLAALLEAMAGNLRQRLSSLSVFASERSLLEAWNQTETEYAPVPVVAELFEEQAARNPDAPAVEFEGAHLTYRELDRRANQLAWSLRDLGVGPEVVVGLCLERSLEMAVGLLGVLKAGGAYLPLDPSSPPARLAFLLEDAGAALVITQQERKRILLPCKVKVFALDSERDAISRQSPGKPSSGVSPENLAYVIYTSGSTGTPKGVLVPHRSLTNHSFAIRERFGLAPADRALQFSSIAFDVAAEEMFPAWASGATVVLPPEAVFASLRGFGDFLQHRRVTVANLPSSFWREWVDDLSRSGARLPTCLRLVVVGSEAVSAQWLTTWRALPNNHVRWLNAYGLSETTITSTLYEPPIENGRPIEESASGLVPVGRPLPNTRVYVLDSEMRPVPIGATGEVFIGGAGVARGYLNRADLTRERFLPDPFDPDSRSRLYRTGDRGSYLPDGNLVLSGRADDQVKIRGFRVEPGEVEAALLRHASVREAAVLVREDSSGDRSLVAFLAAREVSSAGRGVAGDLPEGIRNYLGERLPEWMIPSHFVVLQALPRTRAGKVDRRALSDADVPAPERELLSTGAPDPLEIRLVEIWGSVLRIHPIRVTDNFFHLGGHSLLAVRLFSKIEKVVGRRLPIATLFQAPTIQKLAQVLRQADGGRLWASLVAISPEGTRPPFYCIHAAGGNLLTYFDLARHLGPDQPVYGLQARGLDGRESPNERIEDMAAEYVAAIREFQPEGPYQLGGSSAGGLVAFEMAQQLRAQGQDVAVLALFDTWGPGYPRLLSGKRGLRMARLLQRIDLHLGNLFVAEGRAEKLRYLRSKAGRLKRRWFGSGQAPDVRLRGLPRALRRVQDATVEAADRYVPLPYLGRVALFRATKQPVGVHPDAGLGWGQVALGGLDIYEVPGYHGSIVYEPRCRILAERLDRCLRDAQDRADRRTNGAAREQRGVGDSAARGRTPGPEPDASEAAL